MVLLMTHINECADNLHICKAECCKEFSIVVKNNFAVPKQGDTITFKRICTRDLAFYYHLHGAVYKHGLISVTLNDFRVEGNIIFVLNRCEALTDDLKCKYHGTDRQPKICHRPNFNERGDCNGLHVTPNCLYK